MFVHSIKIIVTPEVLTLYVIMEFNFYRKVKLLFSYMDCGYIEEDAVAIRKQCRQNKH